MRNIKECIKKIKFCIIKVIIVTKTILHPFNSFNEYNIIVLTIYNVKQISYNFSKSWIIFSEAAYKHVNPCTEFINVTQFRNFWSNRCNSINIQKIEHKIKKRYRLFLLLVIFLYHLYIIIYRNNILDVTKNTRSKLK